MQYLISICIPAYKRTAFLQRLLDSIVIQTCKDFEVIVTDDSPDEAVKILCAQYSSLFPLAYYRNDKPLGTPENWNEAIRKAKGAWIKLVHDDDWFADENALQGYVDAIQQNPAASFIFAAYRDIFLDKDESRTVFISAFRHKALLKNTTVLFSKNVIGPPSVILHKNDQRFFYDSRVKWVVDIDFYIRYLEHTKPVYVGKILMNVGLGKEQVTQDCFGQRKVEIPENFYLLNKAGVKNLRNLLVYDAWWRLMRNLEIQKTEDISEAGYTGKIPGAVLSMIRWQSKMPRSLLTTGIFSKSMMFLNYLLNVNRVEQ